MVRESEARLALRRPRLVGSNAPTRNHALRAFLPGGSGPDSRTTPRPADQIHPPVCPEERFRRLYRCDWGARRQALLARVENDLQPIPRRTRWVVGFGSAARLLLLDDRHRGRRPGGVS